MGGMLLEQRKQLDKILDMLEATKGSGGGTVEEEMKYRPWNGKKGKERGPGKGEERKEEEKSSLKPNLSKTG